MTGAQFLGSLAGISDASIEVDGAGVFAANDFVKASSGEAVVATATHKILGIANEAATAASEDVQINITPYMVVLMDCDNVGTTFATTHRFQYADFTGASGAMQVDSSDLSTTVAQLQVLEYNPQGYGHDSDTSIGKFLVVEREISEQLT